MEYNELARRSLPEDRVGVGGRYRGGGGVAARSAPVRLARPRAPPASNHAVITTPATNYVGTSRGPLPLNLVSTPGAHLLILTIDTTTDWTSRTAICLVRD